MPQLRRNEWNFASNAASRISEILATPEYSDSPLGHAEAELTEFMGNRRLDLVVFARSTPNRPLITGELKVPWDPVGRTPHNSRLVEDAHRKASNCGATFFLTWNIRRAVIWRTDDPGVPLLQRVLHDQELLPTTLTSAADLNAQEFRNTWRKAIDELVAALHRVAAGRPDPIYLPLDRQFIARLESLLDFPIAFTANALSNRLASDTPFRRRVESWMRDRQGWTVGPATTAENIDRASRFTCYVLVNRLCFYNALRRRFPQLGRIAINNRISTGEALQRRLTTSFAEAMRCTGDYDTVFDVDVGDDFPFLSDDAVPEWRSLVRSFDTYDFATIDLEVIGSMYERLISPEERHRYGQHYTQPAVVDLINSFAINNGAAVVFDPACGGGTFLVRAYARKRVLNPAQDHTDLLRSIYGCDVLRYACHLSVINLAVRDLIDDDNFPQIHAGDYLELDTSSVFAEIPTRLVAGGLPTGTRQLQLNQSMFDAIVGNPPYIQSRQMLPTQREAYLALVQREWPGYEWSSNCDILVWFFTHSAQFLAPDGHLCLLTQSAWLDVEYGIELQRWLLENFKIVAILESEVEPWFTDARVATVVTILRRCSELDERENNAVRFVQFRRALPQSASGQDEQSRQRVAEQLRDAILAPQQDATEEMFRLRLVRQSELRARGTGVESAYVGSKWGRYLRTLDSCYRLQRDHDDSFCQLGDLASITRGITTNCDSFFIVTDASDSALAAVPTPHAFQMRYGIRRSDVVDGRYRIVHRDDGVELPLDSTYLVPILKTARDVNARSSSAIAIDSFAVRFSGTRSQLSRFGERYVVAGEREHWHESASFAGREDWYVLREANSSPILFVKTIQYVPQLIWNDSRVLANQRLYNLTPQSDIDPETLAAMLNSTVFAAERFAGVKALGREAANDVEVFTARQFRVPNVRNFTAQTRRKLNQAFQRLRLREAGPLIESTLLEAGLHEARVYVERTPVSEDIWPRELQDVDRQTIDELLLQAIGVPAKRVRTERVALYNDLIAFTRRARLLELEAQINRRGRAASGPSPQQLADDLWAQLANTNELVPRQIPTGFVSEGTSSISISLPTGQVAGVEGDLFASGQENALRFGRATLVTFPSVQHRDLALLLAKNRVRGIVQFPRAATACAQVRIAIEAYLQDILPRLRLAAAEITENPELQDRILNEATKRFLPR